MWSILCCERRALDREGGRGAKGSGVDVFMCGLRGRGGGFISIFLCIDLEE